MDARIVRRAEAIAECGLQSRRAQPLSDFRPVRRVHRAGREPKGKGARVKGCLQSGDDYPAKPIAEWEE